MRRSTALDSQWKAETQTGETLTFELCKGGYFSDLEEYGLKIAGKTFQDGTPSLDTPVPIQCVKAGTVIACGDSFVTVPCDLFEHDVWYPASGKVERNTVFLEFNDCFEVYVNTVFEMFIRFILYNRHSERYSNTEDYICSALGKPNDGSAILQDNWLTRNVTSKYSCFCMLSKELLGVSEDVTNSEKISALIDFFEQKKADGEPVMVLYRKGGTTIEQYDLQPIWSPSGTVNVLQSTVDLPADLSATMLVRR